MFRRLSRMSHLYPTQHMSIRSCGQRFLSSTPFHSVVGDLLESSSGGDVVERFEKVWDEAMEAGWLREDRCEDWQSSWEWLRSQSVAAQKEPFALVPLMEAPRSSGDVLTERSSLEVEMLSACGRVVRQVGGWDVVQRVLVGVKDEGIGEFARKVVCCGIGEHGLHGDGVGRSLGALRELRGWDEGEGVSPHVRETGAMLRWVLRKRQGVGMEGILDDHFQRGGKVGADVVLPMLQYYAIQANSGGGRSGRSAVRKLWRRVEEGDVELWQDARIGLSFAVAFASVQDTDAALHALERMQRREVIPFQAPIGLWDGEQAEGEGVVYEDEDVGEWVRRKLESGGLEGEQWKRGVRGAKVCYGKVAQAVVQWGQARNAFLLHDDMERWGLLPASMEFADALVQSASSLGRASLAEEAFAVLQASAAAQDTLPTPSQGLRLVQACAADGNIGATRRMINQLRSIPTLATPLAPQLWCEAIRAVANDAQKQEEREGKVEDAIDVVKCIGELVTCDPTPTNLLGDAVANCIRILRSYNLSPWINVGGVDSGDAVAVPLLQDLLDPSIVGIEAAHALLASPKTQAELEQAVGWMEAKLRGGSATPERLWSALGKAAAVVRHEETCLFVLSHAPRDFSPTTLHDFLALSLSLESQTLLEASLVFMREHKVQPTVATIEILTESVTTSNPSLDPSSLSSIPTLLTPLDEESRNLFDEDMKGGDGVFEYGSFHDDDETERIDVEGGEGGGEGEDEGMEMMFEGEFDDENFEDAEEKEERQRNQVLEIAKAKLAVAVDRQREKKALQRSARITPSSSKESSQTSTRNRTTPQSLARSIKLDALRTEATRQGLDSSGTKVEIASRLLANSPSLTPKQFPIAVRTKAGGGV